MIIVVIYLALGYWAVGETIYKNKVLISSKFGGIFFQKLALAFMLGWLLIPVMLLKAILNLFLRK